jgi:hypothetical protein
MYMGRSSFLGILNQFTLAPPLLPNFQLTPGLNQNHTHNMKMPSAPATPSSPYSALPNEAEGSGPTPAFTAPAPETAAATALAEEITSSLNILGVSLALCLEPSVVERGEGTR